MGWSTASIPQQPQLSWDCRVSRMLQRLKGRKEEDDWESEGVRQGARNMAWPTYSMVEGKGFSGKWPTNWFSDSVCSSPKDQNDQSTRCHDAKNEKFNLGLIIDYLTDFILKIADVNTDSQLIQLKGLQTSCFSLSLCLFFHPFKDFICNISTLKCPKKTRPYI